MVRYPFGIWGKAHQNKGKAYPAIQKARFCSEPTRSRSFLVAVGCAIWSAPEKVDDSNDIARMEEEKIVSMVESQGSHIIDREVMQATQHARVDGLLGEGIAVEVWSGECQ